MFVRVSFLKTLGLATQTFFAAVELPGGGGGGGGRLHRTKTSRKKAYPYQHLNVGTCKCLTREHAKKEAEMFVRVGWQKVMLDPRLPPRSGLPVQTFQKWTRTNIHLFGVPISTRKCLYGSMISSEKEADVCTCRLLRRMADPYKHFSGQKKGWARDVGTGPLSGWKVGPAYFFKKFSDVGTGRVRRNVCTGHCKRPVQTKTCPTLPPPAPLLRGGRTRTNI